LVAVEEEPEVVADFPVALEAEVLTQGAFSEGVDFLVRRYRVLMVEPPGPVRQDPGVAEEVEAPAPQVNRLRILTAERPEMVGSE
jgi:hypothetical protein